MPKKRYTDKVSLLTHKVWAKGQKEVLKLAKVNGKYETIFIVNPNLGEEAITAIVEKFKSLIADNGTVVSVDDWGKRRMAYEINDLREGYYTLIEFESLPSFPAELDRVYKITDGVMRSIIVCKD